MIEPLTAEQEAELRRLEREATPGKRAVDVDAPTPSPPVDSPKKSFADGKPSSGKTTKPPCLCGHDDADHERDTGECYEVCACAGYTTDPDESNLGHVARLRELTRENKRLREALAATSQPVDATHETVMEVRRLAEAALAKAFDAFTQPTPAVGQAGAGGQGPGVEDVIAVGKAFAGGPPAQLSEAEAEALRPGEVRDIRALLAFLALPDYRHETSRPLAQMRDAIVAARAAVAAREGKS